MTGTRSAAGSGDVPIDLAPYQSKFLVFPRQGGSTTPQPAGVAMARHDLKGWRMAVDGSISASREVHPWTMDRTLRGFSGIDRYATSLRLRKDISICYALDFGAPSAVSTQPGERLRAALTAPVRDAAHILVNGQSAGTVWAPPYRIDITKLLRSGQNHIMVEVANTALNRSASMPRVDDTLLIARYGERFRNLDSEKITPQPSGLTEPVALVLEKRSTASCPAGRD